MTNRFDRQEIVDRLRNASPAILPSLLLCDFGNLEREVTRLERAGVAALHCDVMDGQFVPNMTYGLPIVEALRSRTELVLDVHLMIERPEKYLEPFYQAGADVITFHAEAVEDSRPLIDEIHRLGAAAGVAINPGTPLSAIDEVVGMCDLVLIMSVEAGFGGQEFNRSALAKLESIVSQRDCDALLEIDGGVNTETIGECVEAGAQLMVAGSAIFRTADYSEAVSNLEALARRAAGATM